MVIKMETIEAIEKRRSIRKFKNEKIDKEIVLDILNAGRLAPSAKNRQPWHFIVLNEKQKNEIGDLLINLKQEEKEEGDYTYSSSVKFTGNIIKNAPVMILVYTTFDTPYLISDTLSLGAQVENILLRATELDLGSLWIRDITHVENKINNLLGINDKKLSSGILLGKKDQDPNPRPRKQLNEITTWF